MNFYKVNIYWEDGNGIKSTFYFRERNNAITYCEEWIKNNFQNGNYDLSDSYESLEDCLIAWQEYREIEGIIVLYSETINFQD